MPRQESIERNKGMVLQALAHKVNHKFKTFCKTDLMDRFLHACIEYFARFFALQKHLGETQDEAAKTGGGRFGSTRGPGVAAESTLRLKSVAAARNRWRMIVKVGTSPMWRTQPAIVP